MLDNTLKLNLNHKTESKYSPTKGEALAVSWSLEHSKMFKLAGLSINGMQLHSHVPTHTPVFI